MTDLSSCVVCAKPSEGVCAHCGHRPYCSQNCANRDWTNGHNTQCSHAHGSASFSAQCEFCMKHVDNTLRTRTGKRFCTTECAWLASASEMPSMPAQERIAILEACSVPLGESMTRDYIPVPDKTVSYKNVFYRQVARDIAELDGLSEKPDIVSNLLLFFKGIQRAIDIYHATMSKGILDEMKTTAKDVMKNFKVTPTSELSIDAITAMSNDITRITVEKMGTPDKNGNEWILPHRSAAIANAKEEAAVYLAKFLIAFDKNQIANKMTQYVNMMLPQLLMYHAAQYDTKAQDWDTAIYAKLEAASNAIASGVTGATGATAFTSFFDIFSENGAVASFAMSLLASSVSFVDEIHHLLLPFGGVPFVAQVKNASTILDIAVILSDKTSKTRSRLTRVQTFLQQIKMWHANDEVGKSVFLDFLEFARTMSRDDFVRTVFGMFIFGALSRRISVDSKVFITDPTKASVAMIDGMLESMSSYITTLVSTYEERIMELVVYLSNLNRPRGEKTDNIAPVTTDSIFGKLVSTLATLNGPVHEDVVRKIEAFSQILPIYVKSVLPVAVSQYFSAFIDICITATGKSPEPGDEPSHDFDAFIASMLDRVQRARNADTRIKGIQILGEDYVIYLVKIVLGNSGALLGKLQQLLADQIKTGGKSVSERIASEIYDKIYDTGKIKYPAMAPLELYTVAKALGVGETGPLSNFRYLTTKSATVGNIVIMTRRVSPERVLDTEKKTYDKYPADYQKEDDIVPSFLNNYEDLIIKFGKPRTLLLLAFESRALNGIKDHLLSKATGSVFGSDKARDAFKKTARVLLLSIEKEYVDLLTEFNFVGERSNTEEMSKVYKVHYPMNESLISFIASKFGWLSQLRQSYINVGNVETEDPSTYIDAPFSETEKSVPAATLFSKATRVAKEWFTGPTSSIPVRVVDQSNPDFFVARMLTYAQSRALGYSLEDIAAVKKKLRVIAAMEREREETKTDVVIPEMTSEERKIALVASDDDMLRTAFAFAVWEWIGKLIDYKSNPSGLFHADLHAGNIFYYNGLADIAPKALILSDGTERDKTDLRPKEYIDRSVYVTFIDYGKVGKLDPGMRPLVLPILASILTLVSTSNASNFADKVTYVQAATALTQLLLTFIQSEKDSILTRSTRRTLVDTMQSALLDGNTGSTEGVGQAVLGAIANIKASIHEFAQAGVRLAAKPENKNNGTIQLAAAAVMRRYDAIKSIETLVRALLAILAAYKKLFVDGLGMDNAAAMSSMVTITAIPVRTMMDYIYRAITDLTKSDKRIVENSRMGLLGYFVWNQVGMLSRYVAKLDVFQIITESAKIGASYGKGQPMLASLADKFIGLAAWMSFFGSSLVGHVGAALVTYKGLGYLARFLSGDIRGPDLSVALVGQPQLVEVFSITEEDPGIVTSRLRDDFKGRPWPVVAVAQLKREGRSFIEKKKKTLFQRTVTYSKDMAIATKAVGMWMLSIVDRLSTTYIFRPALDDYYMGDKTAEEYILQRTSAWLYAIYDEEDLQILNEARSQYKLKPVKSITNSSIAELRRASSNMAEALRYLDHPSAFKDIPSNKKDDILDYLQLTDELLTQGEAAIALEQQDEEKRSAAQ